MTEQQRPLNEKSGDERRVESAKDAEARLLQRQWDDVDLVMSTEEGRRLLWRLIGRCGLYDSSYREGHPDTTAFNEGQRAIGLELTKELTEQHPDAYAQMVKESVEDRAREQALREAREMNHAEQDEEEPSI